MGWGSSSGSWDALMSDSVNALRRTAHGRDMQEMTELVNKQADRAQAAEEENAANLAEKYALREALKKLDPNHALLTNQDLRTRIHNAAISAFNVRRRYEDARDVGATFKI